MNAVTKLADAKAKLATMLESEEANAPEHVKKQWTLIINQLNEVLTELSATASQPLNSDQELSRTTRKLSPGEDGPHPVEWGF
jgi:hypothetical protein